MIFNLVEYTCFNQQGAETVLNALRKAAQYQLDHSITGVITYHFSRPATNEPEKLRFIEFYTSAKVFWEHSMDPEVGNELMKTFDPTIRKSFSWWAIYSEDIETNVKETVAILGGIEVTPIEQHINLNYASEFNLEPVFLVGKVSEEPSILQGFLNQKGEPFSESTIYQFAFTDQSGDLHLISLWPNQADLINSLRQLELPEAELGAQIYLGNVKCSPQLKQIFAPWNPKFLTTPNAGYCLYPNFEFI